VVGEQRKCAGDRAALAVVRGCDWGIPDSLRVLHTQRNGSNALLRNGALHPVIAERTMTGGLQLKLQAPSGVTLQLLG